MMLFLNVKELFSLGVSSFLCAGVFLGWGFLRWYSPYESLPFSLFVTVDFYHDICSPRPRFRTSNGTISLLPIEIHNFFIGI